MRQEILEHINRVPFIPFRLTLTSGEGFDVSNPDLVAMGENVMHLMYPRSDRYAIIRLNQVATIQVLEAAQ